MEQLPDLGSHLVVLSPHDDDAALGAGGLIKARSEQGKKNTVIVLTDGSLGYSTPDEKGTIVKTRKAECARCYSMLGADVINLDFPDMGLHPYRCWSTPDGREGAYQAVIRHLRELDATALLMPNPADRHPDHKAAYDIGTVAVFQAGSRVAEEFGKPISLVGVFCYAVWGRLPEETHYHQVTPGQRIAKEKALASFRSQRDIIHSLLSRSEGNREMFLGMNP